MLTVCVGMFSIHNDQYCEIIDASSDAFSQTTDQEKTLAKLAVLFLEILMQPCGIDYRPFLKKFRSF